MYIKLRESKLFTSKKKRKFCIQMNKKAKGRINKQGLNKKNGTKHRIKKNELTLLDTSN